MLKQFYNSKKTTGVQDTGFYIHDVPDGIKQNFSQIDYLNSVNVLKI